MLKRRTERRKVAREANETVQVVAFLVGEERYGLEISSVQEIDHLQPVTRVPQSLAFVEGVIHLRGTIIPVIDLAKRFGLPAIVPERRTRIIIATLRGQSVGFIVTAVTEVLPIAVKAIGPPPPLAFGSTARFVTGMARVGDGLISILSLDRLLSTEEVEALQQQQTLF